MSAFLETVDGAPLSRMALGATGTGTAGSATAETDAARIAIYRTALELGVNLFDTAELYGGGYSEELLGRAFTRCRESVFICSKFDPCHASRDGIREAVERSLRRLGTDYLDLYQLHWPSPFVPFEESWSALSTLLDTGKIRHVGVGNCSWQEFGHYQEVSGGRISCLELPFNAAEPDAAAPFLAWASDPHRRLFAYSPLGQGRLCRRREENPQLARLMERHGISENQLALAWALAHPGVVPVFTTGKEQHLRDNVAATSISLTPQEVQVVAEACLLPLRSVPVSHIDGESPPGRAGYAGLGEALENRLDWIPSPALLAERMRQGAFPPPLRLVGPDGQGRYQLDRYDLGGEMKKYWGWRLFGGDAALVPAHVFATVRTR